MKIRKELPVDIEDIYAINKDAFETDAEANLVNALRESGCTFISIVAEIDDQVVGHILFTPVKLSNEVLTGDKNTFKIIGLAPMAVLSQYQNQGIGSKLVEAGLAKCKELGYDAVVVLGHPDYYPRFGFVTSTKFGIKSEYDVPDNVFMIKELKTGCLKGHQGVIKYNDIFSRF